MADTVSRCHLRLFLLQRHGSKQNPFDIGLRDPSLSLDPQQPHQRRIVGQLYLAVVDPGIVNRALAQAAKRTDAVVLELPRGVDAVESMEVVKRVAETLFAPRSDTPFLGT
jgi:hypothetical protein